MVCVNMHRLPCFEVMRIQYLIVRATRGQCEQRTVRMKPFYIHFGLRRSYFPGAHHQLREGTAECTCTEKRDCMWWPCAAESMRSVCECVCICARDRLYVNEAVQFSVNVRTGNESNCVPDGMPQSCRNENKRVRARARAQKNNKRWVHNAAFRARLEPEFSKIGRVRDRIAYTRFYFISFYALLFSVSQNLSVEIMLSVHLCVDSSFQLLLLPLLSSAVFVRLFFSFRFALIACWYTFINHFNG